MWRILERWWDARVRFERWQRLQVVFGLRQLLGMLGFEHSRAATRKLIAWTILWAWIIGFVAMIVVALN